MQIAFSQSVIVIGAVVVGVVVVIVIVVVMVVVVMVLVIVGLLFLGQELLLGYGLIGHVGEFENVVDDLSSKIGARKA